MKKNMAFEPTLIIKREGNQNIDATLILNNNYPIVQNNVQAFDYSGGWLRP